MRQIVYKIIIILICMVSVCGFVYADSKDELAKEEPELSFYLGKQEITAWNDGKDHYLFLPSYAEWDELELTPYSVEFMLADSGILVLNGQNVPELPMDEALNCISLTTGEPFTLKIMKSEHLPTLYIETDSHSLDEIWADKEIEENGKIQVYSVTGEELYSGGLKGIKSRGNYSFDHFAKKPFALTLKDEVSLLGLGKGQKYILITNASDPTLIRNDIVRRMETVLGTEYDNVGEFLDLYVNGEFLGNYYLCEKIEIGDERISITDMEEEMDLLYQKSNYDSFELYETENMRSRVLDRNPLDITGGYLVEREFESRYTLEYVDNQSSFITQGEEHFIVESPKYCSVEQIRYLENCFSEAEKAILAKDGVNSDTKKDYREYIDMDSFVKKYLVEEVSKNYDAGISSMFFYKDSDLADGRIKAGPAWDFDVSFGNYLEWMEYFSKDPMGVSKLALHGYACPWYEALYEKEEYYEKVCQYYQDAISPYLMQMTDTEIDCYRRRLSSSAAMNEIRWCEDFENNPYYRSQDESFLHLKWFIDERRKFLDSTWIDDVEYEQIITKKDGVIETIHYKKAVVK